MDRGDEFDEVEVVQLPTNDEIKADLNDRRTFIGGSDAPVILGISPWKPPYELWMEKTGQAEAPDISEVERVRFGILLEDIVAREFMARTGMKVRRMNQRQVSKEFPWMVAQIDRRIVGGGILECKTADASRKADWDDGIPAHYMTQVQHQLMVTGEAFAFIAVLFGGNSFHYFKIDRDEELIESLKIVLADFWHKVQTLTPPEPSSTEEARQMWRKPLGEVVIGGEEEKEIIKSLLSVKENIESLKERQDELELALQKKLENLGDTLTVGGIPVVSWKMQSRTTLDTKALEASYPDIAGQFKRTSESRTFRVLKGAKEVA